MWGKDSAYEIAKAVEQKTHVLSDMLEKRVNDQIPLYSTAFRKIFGDYVSQALLKTQTQAENYEQFWTRQSNLIKTVSGNELAQGQLINEGAIYGGALWQAFDALYGPLRQLVERAESFRATLPKC
jgi:hypothetical protein